MSTTRIITTLLLTLTSFSILAGGEKETSYSNEQALVEDLPVCYAKGTDLIGRAVNTQIAGANPEDPANISDPDFAAALVIYRACFAKEFSFTLAFDGIAAQTVPAPDTRTKNTDAALQWANFVNNAFREARYKSTQHHMGSISSEVKGNQADIVSYVIATHVFGPNGDQPEGSVSVIGGTYTDRAIRENGMWRLKERTLNVTSSVVTVAQ